MWRPRSWSRANSAARDRAPAVATTAPASRASRRVPRSTVTSRMVRGAGRRVLAYSDWSGRLTEGAMRTIGRAQGAGWRIMPRLLAAALVLGVVSGSGLPRDVRADGAWLDDQSVSWNTAGMTIPGPGQMQSNIDPRCVQQARPAESEEDRAVEAAGWTLFANYTAGWGIKI